MVWGKFLQSIKERGFNKLCIQDTDFCRDTIPLCPYFQGSTDNVLLDRRIKGLKSVKPLQKRGLIGEIRIYNLNN
jgi:hypothetical protein